MKKNNKEDWTEEIFLSMQGSIRAKPQVDLFKQIEEKLSQEDYAPLKVQKSWMHIAAAILVFCINVGAVYYASQNIFDNAYIQKEQDINLISNYYIYK